MLKLIIQFAPNKAMVVYQKYKGLNFFNKERAFVFNHRCLTSATCPENAFPRENTFFVRGGSKSLDWTIVEISDYHKKILVKMVKAYNET